MLRLVTSAQVFGVWLFAKPLLVLELSFWLKLLVYVLENYVFLWCWLVLGLWGGGVISASFLELSIFLQIFMVRHCLVIVLSNLMMPRLFRVDPCVSLSVS